MPLFVKIDEEDRKGRRDVHDIEIPSDEEPNTHRQETPTLVPESGPVQVSPSPAIERAPKRTSVSTGVGTDVAIEDRIRLIEPDPIIYFDQIGGHALATETQFGVRNVSSKPVMFKIKTTSPDLFRVNPTIGTLRPGSRGVVLISTRMSVDDRINRDRFQIEAASLENETFDGIAMTDLESGDELQQRQSFQEINRSWKNLVSVPGKHVETHKIQCRLRVPQITQPPLPNPQTTTTSSVLVQTEPTLTEFVPQRVPSPGTINLHPVNVDEETRRALRALEQSVDQNNFAIESSIDWLSMWIYVLAFIIVVASLLLWFHDPSCCSQAGSKTSPPPTITISPGSGNGKEIPIKCMRLVIGT